MNARRCPFCANDLPADAATCPACGGAVQTPQLTMQPAAQPFEPQAPRDPASAGGKNKTGLISIVATLVAVAIGGAVMAGINGLNCSPPSAPPVPGAVNQDIQGVISGSSPNRTYEFQITQTGPVTISVTSAFDNYLELYGADSDRALRTDDDSGEGRNAQITTTLTPGTYYAFVCAYSDGTGPFRLHISAPREPSVPQQVMTPTPQGTAAQQPGGPPLTDPEARALATQYYSTRSEWAGQYAIRIVNTRLEVTGPDAVTLHASYNYTCIQRRCGGARTGQDQRLFTFQRSGGQWQVTSMGGHMSATF